MAQKENIVEEALVQIKGLEDIVTENAKGILSATMGNEINSLVKESLKANTKKARRITEDEDDEDDLEKDMDEILPNDLPDDMDLDDLDDDEMDLDDLDDDEMDSEDDMEFNADDFENDTETDIRIDAITGDDEAEVDLTHASTDEILKVFKAMKETDGIIVKRSGNTIDLSDSESDVEYKISLGESMKRRNLLEQMDDEEEFDMSSGDYMEDNDDFDMPSDSYMYYDDEEYDDEKYDYEEDDDEEYDDEEFDMSSGDYMGNDDDNYPSGRVKLDPRDQDIIDNDMIGDLSPEETQAHIQRVIKAGRKSKAMMDDIGFEPVRGEYAEGSDDDDDDDTLNEEILYELELDSDIFPDNYDDGEDFDKFDMSSGDYMDDNDDFNMSSDPYMDDKEYEDDDDYFPSDDMDLEEGFKPKGIGMGKPSKFSYKKHSGGFKTKMKRGTRGVGMGKPKFEFKEDNSDFKMTPKKSEATEASRTLGSGKFFGKKGLPKPKAAPRHLRTESVKNELLLLRERNEEYRNALNMFREKLNEVAVFNSNLAYATRLFTEHSTTKQEKINILRRFDSVESLKESKNLYKSIKNELSNKNSGGVVTESIQNKIDKTQYSGSASNLIESKTYENPQFLRMKDLMTKVNNVI